jgi:hypothetical protein
MNSWTSADDDNLQEVLFCNTDCDDFESPIFQTHPQLSKFTPDVLRWRTKLSSQFEAVFSQLLSNELMSNFVLQARAAIPLNVKINPIFDRGARINPPWAGQANAAKPLVTLDRRTARQYYKSRQGRSLLEQVIALENKGEFVLSRLRTEKDSPWTVQLLNENVNDGGGPGRECFADVASEFFHKQLGLFILTPNSQCDEQALKLFIPNPAPLERNSIQHSMYRFAGAWMAVAITSRLPQPFPFAAIVWKALTRTPLTIDDIYEIDGCFKEWMGEMEKMGSSCLENAFQVRNSAGILTELLLNGKSIQVTPRDHREYMEMCQTFRIHEFDSQFEAMRIGFDTIIKEESARLLTPRNLQLLSSGLTEFTISDLRRRIKVMGTPVQCDMFWEMMEQFTAQERLQFITFGSAKVNLPPAGVAIEDRFKVNFVDNLPCEMFPVAMTCNCIVQIPPYSTVDEMLKKFRIVFSAPAPIEH